MTATESRVRDSVRYATHDRSGHDAAIGAWPCVEALSSVERGRERQQLRAAITRESATVHTGEHARFEHRQLLEVPAGVSAVGEIIHGVPHAFARVEPGDAMAAEVEALAVRERSHRAVVNGG